MFKGLQRVVYQVPDLERAKCWYQATLGVDPTFESPIAVVFKIGSYGLTIVPQKNNLPNPEKTIAYWDVDDVDESYKQLIEAGCVPHAEPATLLGVRVASVADPFGNIIGLTSKKIDARQTSVENQPSETALIVASLRALAAHDERQEIRGRDYLAEIFLTEERKQPLHDRAMRDWVMKSIPPGLYEFVIARTAYFDAVVEKALKEGILQLIFLGAGYDSRPYRFSESIGDTGIFELDARLTQERKLALLRKFDISIPENVCYVPANFNSDSLETVLLGAGYDRNKKTLFVWEGVTYYLSDEGVDATLAFVVNHAPAGSRVCFDFQIKAPEQESLKTQSPGEPIKFGIEAGQVEEFFVKRGLSVVEICSASEMEERYLKLANGSIIGNVAPVLSIVCTEVAGR